MLEYQRVIHHLVQRIIKLNKVQLITIDSDNEGQRIDNFLLRILKGVPKSHIYRVIRKGEVRINKKRAKALQKLKEGDLVRVPPVKVSEDTTPEVNVKLDKVQALESQIIYESKSIIVLNKPHGLAVHGGSGLSFGVIEALRQLRPEQKFLELVHRLDRDTSGCLLIAKKRSTLRLLHDQLRNKDITKDYHALVKGRWPKKTKKVTAPLAKFTLKSGERVVRVQNDGKSSDTRFEIISHYANSTLVKASPVTGRTHQIRVHAQYVGCPIASDPKYSDPDFNAWLKETFQFDRLFLHAHRLVFREKADGELIEVIAPYDDALAGLIEQLKSHEVNA